MPRSVIASPSFERRGRLGLVTLNRRDSLNALTLSDAEALDTVLAAWEADAAVGAVLLRSAGGRGFFSGIDLRAVYAARRRGESAFTRRYLAAAYRLSLRLARFGKPLLSLLDGIVMGGGGGLGVFGSARVATEALRFAVPGSGIGFFPDGGLTWALSRLPEGMGMYLALTGAAIGPGDALDLGLASDFVSAARLAELTRTLETTEAAAALAMYRSVAPVGALREQSGTISRVFTQPTLERVLQSLARETGDFARATRSVLARRCPASLCVTFEALRHGRDLDIEECLRMEFRLAERFLMRTDLYEGIRATLEDRDKAPIWLPGTIDGVGRGLIESCFAPREGRELDLSPQREAATFAEDENG